MTRLRGSLSRNGTDVLVAVGLAIACAAYLISFPHRLGAADEGLILYEAKRLLAGDVYFRDLFQIIPPGSQYVVAGAFWLFGTTIVTARAVDAAVQTLIAVLVYGCARTAGVRRPLALIAALLHPVFFQPVWPCVSPHWMSTALALVLLWVCMRRPWSRRSGRAAATGLVVGLMALVQHQRSVPFAAGVATLLVLDAWVGRRFGERTAAATVAARIAACAAAALLVAVPPFIIWTVAAGIQPVVRGLIVFPFANYHSHNSATWGATWLITRENAVATFPVLIRWASIALVAVGAAGAVRWWRRTQLTEVRTALALVVIGVAQIGAILYFPDLIHLAFIAPLAAVAAAVVLEWTLQAVGESARIGVVTGAAALVLVGLIGWRAAQLRARAWARVAASMPTAFGRIDFDDKRLPGLVAAVAAHAEQDPERRLLCYPGCPAVHLMTDTRNPTPFQLLLDGYSASDQLAVAFDIVARAAVPLVFTVGSMGDPRNEFKHAVEQHYTPVPGEPFLWQRAEPAAVGVAPRRGRAVARVATEGSAGS